MVSTITIDTFLPWLAQESQKAAESPRTGNYLTDQLWHVTLDALDWLRELPPDQRTAVLERVRQWLSTGQVDTLTTERNLVFYTIGKKRDLVDRGVAVEEGSKFLFFGGKSLQPARQLDNTGFTSGDMRSLTVVALPDSSKKYKIISRQNLAGLGAQPSEKGEFQGSIQISNPELFWGPSKYLIVVEQ